LGGLREKGKRRALECALCLKGMPKGEVLSTEESSTTGGEQWEKLRRQTGPRFSIPGKPHEASPSEGGIGGKDKRKKNGLRREPRCNHHGRRISPVKPPKEFKMCAAEQIMLDEATSSEYIYQGRCHRGRMKLKKEGRKERSIISCIPSRRF